MYIPLYPFISILSPLWISMDHFTKMSPPKGPGMGQAVSIQRLEHQLSQQKFYTDQAEVP